VKESSKIEGLVEQSRGLVEKIEDCRAIVEAVEQSRGFVMQSRGLSRTKSSLVEQSRVSCRAKARLCEAKSPRLVEPKSRLVEQVEASRGCRRLCEAGRAKSRLVAQIEAGRATSELVEQVASAASNVEAKSRHVAQSRGPSSKSSVSSKVEGLATQKEMGLSSKVEAVQDNVEVVEQSRGLSSKGEAIVEQSQATSR